MGIVRRFAAGTSKAFAESIFSSRSFLSHSAAARAAPEPETLLKPPNTRAASPSGAPTRTAGSPDLSGRMILPSASLSIILPDRISAKTRSSFGASATASASSERLKRKYPTFPPARAFAISTAPHGAPVIAFSTPHNFSAPERLKISNASLRKSAPETFAFTNTIFPFPAGFSQTAGSPPISPMGVQPSGIFTDLKWNAFIDSPPIFSSPETALLSAPKPMPAIVSPSGFPYSSSVSASKNSTSVPPPSAYSSSLRGVDLYDAAPAHTRAL